MKRCCFNAKDILKRNTGIFSNFKSTAKPMIVAMLAANENPAAAYGAWG